MRRYGPFPAVHLSARAAEWLRGTQFKARGQNYAAPVGAAACHHDPEILGEGLRKIPLVACMQYVRREQAWVNAAEFCGVEDVRAIVGNEKRTRFYLNFPHDKIKARIITPTCPHCVFLFDWLMEATRQRP